MGKAFITARCRDRILYIEKSEIISVIKSPRIWKVPGAPEEISGIMQHEDKMVVFYKISCLEQPPCAVLMNGGSGPAFGFGAEEMGEELAVALKDAGQLNKEDFRQVMPGVWEEKSDTTE